MNNMHDDFPGNAKMPYPLRWLFLKDLVLGARIGVYPHEHQRKQKIRISVYYAVRDDEDGPVGADRLERTVSYDEIIACVQDNVEAGHVELVETLAEKIAVGILCNQRVEIVRVCVEKLDVLTLADSVGVWVERRQKNRDK